MNSGTRNALAKRVGLGDLGLLALCCIMLSRPVSGGDTPSVIEYLYFKNNGPSTASVWVNGVHQGCVNGGGDTRYVPRNGFSTLDSGLQPDGTRNPDVQAFGGWQPSDPLEVVATMNGADGKEIRTVISVPQGTATEAYVWFGEGKPGPAMRPSEIEFAKKMIPCGYDVATGAAEEKERLELRTLRKSAFELKKEIADMDERMGTTAEGEEKADAGYLRTKIAETEQLLRERASRDVHGRLDPGLLRDLKSYQDQLAAALEKGRRPKASAEQRALQNRRALLAERLDAVVSQIEKLANGQAADFATGNRGAREALTRKAAEKRLLFDNLDLGTKPTAPTGPSGDSLLDVIGGKDNK